MDLALRISIRRVKPHATPSAIQYYLSMLCRYRRGYVRWGLLCVVAHVGCSSQQLATNSPARPSAPQTVAAAPAEIVSGPEACPQIDAGVVARAKSMTLENADELELGVGELRLDSLLQPLAGREPLIGPLHVLRFDSLSESEAAAAEAHVREDTEVRVLVDFADGSSRPGSVVRLRDENQGADLLDLSVIVRPTTRAIRFMYKGRLVERLDRPQTPPEVEALVLRERPLSVAVKVTNPGNPTLLMLREDLPGEPRAMAYANETIRPGRAGADPCWLLIPDARGREGDQGAAVTLTLWDAFHRWRFRYVR